MVDSTQDKNQRISIKSTTTSTAKVTGTSGKAKAVNVVKTKRKVFEKPDANKIAEEVAAQVKAAEEARLKAAEEKQATERTKKEAAERQAATLAAMRANNTADAKSETSNVSVVVKKAKKDDVSTQGKADTKADKAKKSSPKPNKAETAAAKKLGWLVRLKKKNCVS